MKSKNKFLVVFHFRVLAFVRRCGAKQTQYARMALRY